MSWKSAVYDGWVRHRRFEPTEHAFRYRHFLYYLDLAELPALLQGTWLWSHRPFALTSFRRSDFLGPRATPLDVAVRDLVEAHGQPRPRGPIRLLTQLRTFGMIFNPVSVYFCFDESGAGVDAIVLEVSNTPWGQRHCYVLPPSVDLAARTFVVAKAFHVSPFLGMDLEYRLRFTVPEATLVVHMECVRRGQTVLDATLTLTRRPISTRTLAGVFCRSPGMALHTLARIYWQAFRLWWKSVPFIPHPGSGGSSA